MSDAVARCRSFTQSESQRSFASLNAVSWLLTIGLACLAAILFGRTGATLQVNFLSFNLLVAAVFGSVGLAYCYWRFDPRIAGCCNAVAIAASFTFVAAIASYLATILGAGRPLYDARFLAADRALGFQWRDYLALLDRHDWLEPVLNRSYGSILKQVGALIACLVVLGQIRRLQIFILAVQMALLICVAAPAVIPAVGAYGFLGITSNVDHPHLLMSTMSRSVDEIYRLRSLAPDLKLDESVGLVVFPSFHTVLAIFFIWAFWSVPVVQWFAVVLNLAMLAATPIWGGHYLVDMLAGTGLALMSLGSAQSIAGSLERRASISTADAATDALPIPG